MKKLFRSAGIVAASTIASRTAGLARDMVMAAFFGATASADAFYAAFRIPNLVRRLSAEGVLSISFIPVYMDYLVNKNRSEAIALAQKTLTLLFIIMASLVAAGIVWAPEITRIIAAGFEDRSQVYVTAAMVRIMLPYVFVAVMLSFCMGVLNSHNYFFAPSFAPVLLNIGILSGIVFFSGFFNEPLYGVCVGVLCGGLLQILLQLPYMAKAGFRMKFAIDLRHPGVRRIFKLAVPGAFSMGIQQINILTATILGSFLAGGSISYIYFSDRIHELVLGVFAVSIGNAVMPEMSALAADRKFTRLIEVYALSVRSALFFTIPATAALMLIGFPVISVLLMRNNFTPYQADMTYRALFYASMGISCIAISRITVPLFFALQDARTPFFAALASFIINAACGYVLMQTPLAHAGLTAAVSFAATVQMLVLVLALGKRIGTIGLGKIFMVLFKYILAAGIMGLVIIFITGVIDWKTAHLSERVLCLSAAIIAGIIVYAASCYAAGVTEVRSMARRILDRRK
jgi:putative peptidoglycan lipid II flippase